MTAVAVLLVLGASLAWQRQAQQPVLREMESLKQQLAAISRPAPAAAEAAPTPDPALMRELVSLRGELAGLRRDLAARPGGPSPAASSPATTASGNPAASVPAFLKKGWMEAEGLPPAVLATLRQQLGEVPIEGAAMRREDGQLLYGLESRLADGRGVELTVNEQGQVVGRHLETSLEGLDPVVRQQALGQVGEVPVRRVAEIFEDGQTRYRVTAKDPNQAVNVVLAPDGTVLRTEVERRARKP